MRLLEPGGVTLFESPFKSRQVGCSRRILELFSWALLLEILLSRHVQVRFGRRRCAARRLFSGLLTEFISSSFFRRCAVSRAMTVEYRRATHDERRQSDQCSETHRFELSDHLTLTLDRLNICAAYSNDLCKIDLVARSTHHKPLMMGQRSRSVVFTPLQSGTLSSVAANTKQTSVALASVFVASFVIRHLRHILLIPGILADIEHVAIGNRAGRRQRS